MHSGLREPVLFALSAMGWVGAGATWLGLAMDAGVCVGSAKAPCFARRLRNSLPELSPLPNTLHGSLLEYNTTAYQGVHTTTTHPRLM